MSDIADLYDELRLDIAAQVEHLDDSALSAPVPATPNWSIRDIVVHLSADAECALVGDFPSEFFANFGDESVVGALNDWTGGQLRSRTDLSVTEALERWAEATPELLSMMRGEVPWPDGVPMFGERVMLTDACVHRHDINGALGITGDRDSAQVKLAASGYIATVGMRLTGAGIAPLRFTDGTKEWVAGTGEPGASVTASRFEFFRALSGRRDPDQIRAYEWDGEPDLYLPYFFPYGMRHDALIE